MSERTETASSPESYIRINIAQNSKGFTYETTCSHRWNPDDESGEQHLKALLEQARKLALAEVAAREAEAGR